MKKYIIKNCKSLISNDICELYSQKGIHLSSYCYCKDKNCLLKQIVEKCKNYKENCKIEGNCLDERLCSTCFLGGANELGEWILDDLEIEEVE